MKIFRKIPTAFWSILGFFLVTRLIFVTLGLGLAIHNYPKLLCASCIRQNPDLLSESVLNIWKRWDSVNYLGIAKYGYSPEIQIEADGFKSVNYVFFPLYPILINITSRVTRIEMPWAGLFISNISFIASAFVLYKLARLDLDRKKSLNIVKYLFLLPVSFLFSSILTESLFLFLMLLSFYAARKKRWILSGLSGFFLSLTRPVGVLIIFPILIEYLESIDYKLTRIKFDILFLILPILGISLYSIYNYFLVGDFLGFIHRQTLWARTLQNPLLDLVFAFLYGQSVIAIYNLILIFLIFYSQSLLRFSYWVLFMLLYIVPVVTGFSSIFRLTVVIFSLCFILEEISSKKIVINLLLTVFLIVLQIYLFIGWQMGSPLVV